MRSSQVCFWWQLLHLNHVNVTLYKNLSRSLPQITSKIIPRREEQNLFSYRNIQTSSLSMHDSTAKPSLICTITHEVFTCTDLYWQWIPRHKWAIFVLFISYWMKVLKLELPRPENAYGLFFSKRPISLARGPHAGQMHSLKDFFKSVYTVWSAVLYTAWSTHPHRVHAIFSWICVFRDYMLVKSVNKWFPFARISHGHMGLHQISWKREMKWPATKLAW